MTIKNFLWVLLGIAIGVGGYSVAMWTPRPHFVEPDIPDNLSLMFKQAVDNNDLYSLQELTFPLQRDHVTNADLQSLRNYVQVGTKLEGGMGIDNYVVLTFGNKRAVTLWVTPPFGNDPMWRIEKITEGAHVENAQR